MKDILIKCKCPKLRKIIDDLKFFYDEINDEDLKSILYQYIFVKGSEFLPSIASEVETFNLLFDAYNDEKTSEPLKEKINQILKEKINHIEYLCNHTISITKTLKTNNV